MWQVMDQLPKREKITIAKRHMAILALPMIVVAVSEGLLSSLADTNVLQNVALKADAELSELIARYRFLSVFFFYGATALTIIGIFGAELFSRHTKASLIRTGVGLLALVGFTQLYTNWDPDFMGSFKAYELNSATLFRSGLKDIEMPFCAAGHCGDAGGFRVYRILMTITNNISALAVSAVILGMILALSRPGPITLTTQDGILTEAAHLQEAQKATRRYLYLSGALLSISMMYGYGWMHWPAGLLENAEDSSQYEALVDSISLYRGVSYTVLILSFYMPVSLIQMVRIERLHDAARAAKLPQVVEDVKGFDIERVGSLDALKAILSILAPIIAGAVGSFTGVDVLG